MKTMKTDMLSSQAESSTIRRKSGQLYDALIYWLHGRNDRVRASTYADQLWRLLKEDAHNELGVIFSEECWALLYEARGQLDEAIKHRENEIAAIRKLHDLSTGKPFESLVMNQYSQDDLNDRLSLLSILRDEYRKMDRSQAIPKTDG